MLAVARRPKPGRVDSQPRCLSRRGGGAIGTAASVRVLLRPQVSQHRPAQNGKRLPAQSGSLQRQRRPHRSPNLWRRSRRVPRVKQTFKQVAAAGVVEAVDAAPIVWVSAAKRAVIRKLAPADLPTPSLRMRTANPILRARSRQPQAPPTWRTPATRPSSLTWLHAPVKPIKLLTLRSLPRRPAS